MLRLLLLSTCFGIGVAVSAVACSDGGGIPLGGPYGGTGSYTNPSNGGGGSGGSGGSGPTDSGSTTPPTDSGTTTPPVDSGSGGPPPPTDSGSTPPPPTDSGSAPPPKDSGTPPPPPAPTWTEIYNNYVAAGTKGNCGSFCHSSMGSASGAYNYLQGRGQISGTSSAITDPSRSDFSWFGGNMPPGGPSSYPAAQADMQAWVASGAPNN